MRLLEIWMMIGKRFHHILRQTFPRKRYIFLRHTFDFIRVRLVTKFDDVINE